MYSRAARVPREAERRCKREAHNIQSPVISASLPWYAAECVHAYVTDPRSSLPSSCLRFYAFLMISGIDRRRR